jgi:DNA-binding LacI/PurR family transcriptional regulator
MRIGFLIDTIIPGYQQIILQGVQAAAKDLEIQLLTIPGRPIHSTKKGDLPHNLLYDLLHKELFDGYVITATVFGHSISKDQLSGFLSRFEPLPFVSIGAKMKNEPTVLVNNRSGLAAMINHFITKHEYRNFAFIRGPHNNPEAETRYDCFRDTLQTHGLPVSSEWIREGTFESDSGYQCAEEIWASGKKPSVILSANDQMLLGAFQYLSEIGVDVPEQVALGGFDDIDESRFSQVPFTTVHQPIFEQAYEAIKLIHAYISTGKKPEDVSLDTHPVFRESCGCFSKKISIAGFPPGTEGEEQQIPDSPGKLKQRIQDYLAKELDIDIGNLLDQDGVNRILQSYNSYLSVPEKTTENKFLRDLSKVLSEESTQIGNLMVWSSILSAIVKTGMDPKESEGAKSACSLIQKSYIMISEKIDQAGESRFYDQSVRFAGLQESLQRIMEAYDMEEFLHHLAEEIKRLSFKSFYLIFFDGEWLNADDCNEILPENSYIRLMIRNGMDREPEKETYSSRLLLPAGIMSGEKNENLLVQMITYDNMAAGMLLCDSDGRNNDIFESFRSQISSSIRTSKLIEFMTTTQEHLKKRNRQIEEVVMPMLESIENVNRITDDKISSMETIVNQISDSRKTFDKTTESVESISESARYMMDLIKMIDNISEQINILSINASIESARAGQHGKGFGVISGEVRKLADSTAENATQTGETLKKVVENIRITRDSSQESMEAYSQIEQEISLLSQSLNTIQSSMTDLADLSRRIMTIIKQ